MVCDLGKPEDKALLEAMLDATDADIEAAVVAVQPEVPDGRLGQRLQLELHVAGRDVDARRLDHVAQPAGRWIQSLQAGPRRG